MVASLAAFVLSLIRVVVGQDTRQSPPRGGSRGRARREPAAPMARQTLAGAKPITVQTSAPVAPAQATQRQADGEPPGSCAQAIVRTSQRAWLSFVVMRRPQTWRGPLGSLPSDGFRGRQAPLVVDGRRGVEGRASTVRVVPAFDGLEPVYRAAAASPLARAACRSPVQSPPHPDSPLRWRRPAPSPGAPSSGATSGGLLVTPSLLRCRARCSRSARRVRVGRARR